MSDSSSSSPKEMCVDPFKFDFFDLTANSLMSSAKGLDESSRMGLNVLCCCCWSLGELEMLSVDVSMTTVSRLVEVVEFDKVPSVFWLTRLYPCCRGSSCLNDNCGIKIEPN